MDRTRALARFLGAWSFAFAAVHLAWALGWRGGVPDSVAPIAERPWFLAYDVAAGVLMCAAGVGALLLGSGRSSRLLVRVAVAASVLALLRGVPALAWDVAAAEHSVIGLGADLWFTVAGAAGLVLAARARRTSLRTPVAAAAS